MNVLAPVFPSTRPVELQIIRPTDFIRLDVHAHPDFEQSKKALRVLVLACRKRGLERAVLDLRSLPDLPDPHFTQSELAALVLTFREAGFSRNQRLAILYQTDLHHGIRTFAFVNRVRGLQVHAFTEFEEALTWLNTTSTELKFKFPSSQVQPNNHAA